MAKRRPHHLLTLSTANLLPVCSDGDDLHDTIAAKRRYRHDKTTVCRSCPQALGTYAKSFDDLSATLAQP
jgi:hypothetical protein